MEDDTRVILPRLRQHSAKRPPGAQPVDDDSPEDLEVQLRQAKGRAAVLRKQLSSARRCPGLEEGHSHIILKNALRRREHGICDIQSQLQEKSPTGRRHMAPNVEPTIPIEPILRTAQRPHRDSSHASLHAATSGGSSSGSSGAAQQAPRRKLPSTVAFISDRDGHFALAGVKRAANKASGLLPKSSGALCRTTVKGSMEFHFWGWEPGDLLSTKNGTFPEDALLTVPEVPPKPLFLQRRPESVFTQLQTPKGSQKALLLSSDVGL